MDILIHYLQLHCRQSEFMIVKTYLLTYLLRQPAASTAHLFKNSPEQTSKYFSVPINCERRFAFSFFFTEVKMNKKLSLPQSLTRTQHTQLA